MTETIATERPEALFVANLRALLARAEKDSSARGSLARLRRSLGVRDLDLSALREVGAWLPDKMREDDLDSYMLVAALFAMNPPTDSSGRTLGATLKELRHKLSAGAESLDRRVTGLLNADHDELPYRLRQLMQMLKSQNLAPNYSRLLRDLTKWDHPNRNVQRQWARDYWTR